MICFVVDRVAEHHSHNIPDPASSPPHPHPQPQSKPIASAVCRDKPQNLGCLNLVPRSLNQLLEGPFLPMQLPTETVPDLGNLSVVSAIMIWSSEVAS